MAEITGTRGQVIINGKVMTPTNGRVSVNAATGEATTGPRDQVTLGASQDKPEMSWKSMLGLTRPSVQSNSGVISNGVVVQDVKGGTVTSGPQGVKIEFK